MERCVEYALYQIEQTAADLRRSGHSSNLSTSHNMSIGSSDQSRSGASMVDGWMNKLRAGGLVIDPSRPAPIRSGKELDLDLETTENQETPN